MTIVLCLAVISKSVAYILTTLLGLRNPFWAAVVLELLSCSLPQEMLWGLDHLNHRAAHSGKDLQLRKVFGSAGGSVASCSLC